MQIDYPFSCSSAEDEKTDNAVRSGFVTIDGEPFYRIANSDEMAPFLMNIVSGTNHWMFAASNGALTAGRRNADNALFPYCTQDKLFESAKTVGSCTLIWVETEAGAALWEPFRAEIKGTKRSRNLYKSVDGNQVIFEEQDPDLGLSFRYSWMMGERYGFLRHAELKAFGGGVKVVRILDGIQNVVPYGLDQKFVSQFSNLADAYKKNELLTDEGLGIYYLSSIPTDRAEPSEGLKATVVWSVGLERTAVLLSSKQVEAFRWGEPVTTEDETRGERCSYLVESSFELGENERKGWWIAADINQDAVQVERLRNQLSRGDMQAELLEDFLGNQSELRAKIGASDGMQLTANRIRDARHRSNTLFNIMRGGVFGDSYQLSVADFQRYLGSWNRDLQRRYAERLGSFGASVGRAALIDWAEMEGDADLYRLVIEYLPLSFSRRHGDPSRPWNKFSIETQDAKGHPILAYQGNWRDIFQNWEPLGYSYPEYLTGMIFRFLNASTADGYNPYRVTRDGFDWEVLDPNEPWSNIGYWGDHQVVYLLKLLEALEKHAPDKLRALIDRECFVYAHVPYRIRGFAEIWDDPRQTVFYDDEAAAQLEQRSAALGADGKLLINKEGQVARANLIEKLLAPLLAKMSNFVLDGGIWMNTQRPEWNDANNALVGYGVSVVTLSYVHRYLEFLDSLLPKEGAGECVMLDSNLAAFLKEQTAVFQGFESQLDLQADGTLRFKLLEALGCSGERYRESVYSSDFGISKVAVPLADLRSYLALALRFSRHTIDSNRRSDALYHSYNLLKVSAEEQAEVGRLPEMLEGQVAVLNSNRLSTEDSLLLLDALRSSSLYREDVESYLLYPDKELPRFLDKNVVSTERVESSPLLLEMLARKDDRVISKSDSGIYRFNGAFRNAGDLGEALLDLKADYSGLLDTQSFDGVVTLFEDTFSHRSFTGRSGTFFAYEGLGSVYWHMVSKLLLAIQECTFKAKGTAEFDGLAAHYFECMSGLGFDKDPKSYGAFPIDAYSHTPKQAGAQQPGMTGQVKEDILSRWGELGVYVHAGRIHFDPLLLRRNEFIQRVDTFHYRGLSGKMERIELQPGTLAFTYCQTLFVFRVGNAEALAVFWAGGKCETRRELALSEGESSALFSRDGRVARIEVTFRAEQLLSS